MLNLKLRLGAICLCALIFLIGCGTTTDPIAESPTEVTASAPPTEPELSAEQPTTGLADVESIEILMQESFPIQVNVVARGQLPDGCTNLTTIDRAKNGTQYNVTINTLRDPSNGCSVKSGPFEQSIALDVLDIPAGSYTVNVNGVQQAFVLSAKNIAQAEPPPAIPTPEPTAGPESTAESAVEPTEEAETETNTASDGADGEEVKSDGVEEEEAEEVSAETDESDEPVTPKTIFNDPDCVNLVTFDSDISIPDDTSMQPGDTFVKTWRVVNAGSCAWDSTYTVQFVGGDQMEASDEMPLEKIVQTGQSIDISVPLVAPDDLGTYRGDFLLYSPDGDPMGLDGQESETIWLRIEVVEAGTLGEIAGRVWADDCDQTEYIYGVSTGLPPGCVENTNGTVRGDGVFDTDNEQVIPNAVVSLLSGECGSADDLYSTSTDDEGNYRFVSLAPGVYCIYLDVVDPENYDLFIPGVTSFPLPGKTSSTVTIEEGTIFDAISFGWDRSEAEIEVETEE